MGMLNYGRQTEHHAGRHFDWACWVASLPLIVEGESGREGAA